MFYFCGSAVNWFSGMHLENQSTNSTAIAIVDSTLNNDIDIDENTPLNLKETDADNSDSGKDAILNDNYKWHIVFCCGVAWLSVYYVLWTPAYIEHSIINEYNYSSAEYSYLIAICYLGAAIGSFSSSYHILIHNHNHLETLTLFLALLILSTAMFTFVLYFYHEIWMIIPYFWLLVSRFLAGICVGAIDTLIQSVVNFWFTNDLDYLSIAFGILMATLETGVIIGRYVQPIITDAFGIPLSLLFGLLTVIIAFIAVSFVRLLISKQQNSNSNSKIQIQSLKSIELENDNLNTIAIQDVAFWNQFLLLKHLPMKTWLAIIVFIMYTSCVCTMYSVMVEPFVDIYGYTQSYTDLLWGIASIVDVCLLMAWGKMTDHFHIYLETMILGLIMLFFCFLFVCFAVSGIVAVLFTIISLMSISSAFSTMTISVPHQNLAPITTAFATALAWISSLLLTSAFGWIYDATGSYKNSMALLDTYSMMAIVIAIILFKTDFKQAQLHGKLFSHMHT